MDRRKFLKYAGATAALVGASALGLDYLLNLGKEGSQPSATSITTTPDKTPPTIQDYKLVTNPDKVQNDKPYELDLSFTAEDLESALDLSAVSLAFEPIYPPEIPKAAYTPEPNSFQTTYTLNPASVSPDRKKATFSQPIAGFVGGKQYRTTIKVKDKAGNEAEISVDNPYVREFEKLSGEGKKIGAFYYAWFEPWKWKTYDGTVHENKKIYLGTPLLGEYSSKDPFVISKHIDWATGHGIDFFLASWWGQGGFIDDTLRFRFLQNELIGDIELGLIYESMGRLKVEGKGAEAQIKLDNPQNLKILTDDFQYLATNYFLNPNYLKMKNKPVTFIYQSKIFSGDVEHAIGTLRDVLQNGGVQVYLIGDEVFWQNPNSVSESRLKSYDALSAYNMVTWKEDIISNYEVSIDNQYKLWRVKANELGLDFMGSAQPGFNDRLARPQANNTIIKKTPERFRKQISIAKEHSNGTFLITSFNEIHENTYIEPTVEDGFEYLQVLKESLT